MCCGDAGYLSRNAMYVASCGGGGKPAHVVVRRPRGAFGRSPPRVRLRHPAARAHLVEDVRRRLACRDRAEDAAWVSHRSASRELGRKGQGCGPRRAARALGEPRQRREVRASRSARRESAFSAARRGIAVRRVGAGRPAPCRRRARARARPRCSCHVRLPREAPRARPAPRPRPPAGLLTACSPPPSLRSARRFRAPKDSKARGPVPHPVGAFGDGARPLFFVHTPAFAQSWMRYSPSPRPRLPPAVERAKQKKGEKKGDRAARKEKRKKRRGARTQSFGRGVACARVRSFGRGVACARARSFGRGVECAQAPRSSRSRVACAQAPRSASGAVRALLRVEASPHPSCSRATSRRTVNSWSAPM